MTMNRRVSQETLARLTVGPISRSPPPPSLVDHVQHRTPTLRARPIISFQKDPRSPRPTPTKKLWNLAVLDNQKPLQRKLRLSPFAPNVPIPTLTLHP